jgi:cbb3-type cytochrome c oxidase subunit II
MGNRAVFRMDVPTIAFGAFIVFSSVIFTVVALPYLTFQPPQSADARPLTAQEENGRRLFASNGCHYCHSQYLRPQDWTGVGSFRTVGRVAQAGDYYYQRAPLLGTERTGPDLSQEGGVHTDEWHIAHFYNPRFTFPKSVMPQFSFYFTGDEPRQEIFDLIAYVQSLGGKAADDRVARQRALKQKLLAERAKGNEEIIHEWFPSTWRNVRNPMEPTQRSLIHGKYIYETNCIGCHGLKGDGKGPAARWIGGQYQPAPRNFTDVSAQLLFSDGELYDAILFGVDGTAMPAWGDILTVNDIWDVTNFLRTIPRGGLERDPTADMMVSPGDVKPIELTPLPLLNAPEEGQGAAGQASPVPGTPGGNTLTPEPGIGAQPTAAPTGQPGTAVPGTTRTTEATPNP